MNLQVGRHAHGFAWACCGGMAFSGHRSIHGRRLSWRVHALGMPMPSHGHGAQNTVPIASAWKSIGSNMVNGVWRPESFRRRLRRWFAVGMETDLIERRPREAFQLAENRVVGGDLRWPRWSVANNCSYARLRRSPVHDDLRVIVGLVRQPDPLNVRGVGAGGSGDSRSDDEETMMTHA